MIELNYKSIAKFMDEEHTSTYRDVVTGNFKFYVDARGRGNTLGIEAKYNTWEWLMPVVDKICQTKYTDGENAYFRTFGMVDSESGLYMSRINRCSLFMAETLLEAVFLSVVDFVSQHSI